MKTKDAKGFSPRRPVELLLERPRLTPVSRAVAFSLGLVLCSGVEDAIATPTGGTVVQGAATISSPTSSQLNINQSTSKAVIDWRTFSIGSGEQVNFRQPTSSSETLNRVLDGQRSQIDGTLTANGRIYILNSSGVLFGKTAHVNVGGLIATTSNIRDADFMNGNLNFTPGASPGASVENRGTITVQDGGVAALVAPSVRNSGVIQANLGKIALAGGESFTVDFYGDHLINFALPTDRSAGSAATTYSVDQSGKLVADGGRITLSAGAAGGILGGVVNMSGVAQARTASQGQTGEIILDAGEGTTKVSGSIDVSGATGGRVALLGSDVSVTGGAVVNAGGSAGGGNIVVGGREIDTTATQTVEIDAGASLDASATRTGQGGSVRVWGARQVGFAGTITALGGPQSGDGGQIEVSTPGTLNFVGEAYSTAAHGKSGVLLLDPTDITIAASGGSATTDSQIAASSLDKMLRSGQDVVLQATNSITDNATIDGRPTSGSGNSGAVSFTAGELFINSPIITQHNSISLTATTGGITFDKTGYLAVAGSANDAASAITLSAAQNITTAMTAVGAGGNQPDGGELLTAGAVSISSGGDVAFLEALNGLDGTAGLGSLGIQATGSINLVGARSAGAVMLTAGAGGGISNSGAPITAQSGAITLNSGTGGTSLSATTLSGSPVANLQASAGDVVLLSTGTVQLNGGILSSHGNVCIGGGADAACAGAQGGGRVAAVTSVAGGDIQAGSSGSDSGSISVYASHGAELQDLRVGTAGNVLVDSAGGVTLDHALAGFGTTPAGIGGLTVKAGGDVKLAGAYVAGLLQVDTTGTISTGAPAGATLAALVGGAGVTLDGGTGVTLNGYPAGSAAVVAGYGADGTTVVNASAPVSINETRSGAVTIGDGVHATGTVNIGSASAPVASVASTAAIQAGDANGSSTPGISVYATGNIAAADLFTRGALLINSTAGDVTLSSAENGLGASPLASLTVRAGGNDSAPAISLMGARSTGAVTLTAGGGGQISTGGGPITAQTGDITLTSGTGGISLSSAAVSGSGVASLQADAGDVVLLTTGTVQVDGGILSSHGNVCIGGGADAVCAGAQGAGRVAAVTSVAGGDIQAGTDSTDTGSISVYANQSVELQDLRVSTAGHVLVDSLAGVTLDHPLEGIGATPAGIGALTVNAGGDVKLAGAYVGGLLKVDTTGAISTVAPSGGSLASLVGVAGVTLEGATGVTLNGYPSGSAAVLAGYGTDGVTVLNASAPVNINDTRSGAVTIGSAVHAAGAVNIGASGAPVASLTSTAPIQAGDATGSAAPGISIYATNNVSATDLFTRGALFISSTSGDVALSSAENGLGNGNTSSLASLTINAGGNDGNAAISLVGAHSAGAVMLTASGGGGISVGGGPVVADAGDIKLTSGAGGISLTSAAVSGSPVSTLWAAGGDVVLLTSGTVQLDGGVLSSHGNVCVGGGTDAVCTGAQGAGRVAGITSVAGGDIQAGTSGTDTGSITVYSSQATGLQDLRVSSAGYVLVDSQAGVTLNTPLYGIGTTTPTGIGALTINAGGDINLTGANVTGNGTAASGLVNLTCTGANCAIADAAGSGSLAAGIQATHGITLTANGDISIGEQYYQNAPDRRQPGLEAISGNVALSTSGQVLLDSSVHADNGNICIGGAGSPCGDLQLPSAVRMAADPAAKSLTTLQVGDALIGTSPPTIWVRASDTGDTSSGNDVYTDIRLVAPDSPHMGEIWLGSLVGGPHVVVDIKSRDVTVLGSIAGVNQIDPDPNDHTSAREGMGSVTLFGDRAVDVRDINVGTPGTATLANAAPGLVIETKPTPEVGPDGYAEPQEANLNPDGVGISLRGQLISYSPILIGLPAVLDTSPSRTQNAQINLSGNIFTYGQNVTLNGDVTLFNGIDLAMVFQQLAAKPGALLTGLIGSAAPSPYFDINLFKISDAGSANFDAQNPSSSPLFGVVAPIGNTFQLYNESGQPLFKAQATTTNLNDISALFGQLTATIDTRNLNKQTDNGQTQADGSSGTLTINGAVARYVPPSVSLPQAFIATDTGLDGVNPCVVDPNCDSHILVPDPTDLSWGSSNQLQVPFTFNVPADQPPFGFFSTSYVSPSFISQTLDLAVSSYTIHGNVGGGNPTAPPAFVTGTINETLTFDRACANAGCAVTLETPPTPTYTATTENAPEEGYFVIDAHLVSSSTPSTAYESPTPINTTPNTLNYPGASAPSDPFQVVTCPPCDETSPTSPTVALFQFQFDSGNPGSAAFPPGSPGAPSANGPSPVLTFRGGSGGDNPFGSGSGSSLSAGGATTAGGAYSSTSGSGGSLSGGSQTGSGGNLSFVSGNGSGLLGSEVNSTDQSIVSTLTEDSRRQPETNDSAATDTTERCPRGAARTADLGNQAAWSGSATNVFSSCPEAQRK